MQIRSGDVGPIIDVALKSDIVQIYFPIDHPSDEAGFSLLSLQPQFTVESVNTVTIDAGTSPALIEQFLTSGGQPALSSWAGILLINSWASTDTPGQANLIFRFFAQHADLSETLLVDFTGPAINSPDLATLQYDFLPVPIPTPLPMAPDDRLIFRVFAQTASVVPVVVHWVHSGAVHGSYTVHVP
jgi:hypothetical protein